MTTPITDTIRRAEEEFKERFLEETGPGYFAFKEKDGDKLILSLKSHIKSTNLALLKAVEEEVEKYYSGKVPGIENCPMDPLGQCEKCQGNSEACHYILSFLHQAQEELNTNPQGR